jgi:uncharacterized membrane protein
VVTSFSFFAILLVFVVNCQVSTYLFALSNRLWNKSAAETDTRDQGFSSHREEEGCPISEDQEEQGCCQVQGPLLQVLVHPLRIRC